MARFRNTALSYSLLFCAYLQTIFLDSNLRVGCFFPELNAMHLFFTVRVFVYLCPVSISLFSKNLTPLNCVLLLLHLLSSCSHVYCPTPVFCCPLDLTYLCFPTVQILLSSYSDIHCPSVITFVCCHTLQYSAVLSYLQLLSSNSYICCPTVQFSVIFLFYICCCSNVEAFTFADHYLYRRIC
jgi:hypothetical protein